MTRVLVTGSSGFIGSNLCRQLAEEGYDVQGIDIVPPTFEFDKIKTRVGDLTSKPELPDVDVIIHLAAHSQVQPIVESPELAVENIEMTHHVLQEAKRMDAFIINASSRDVYGDSISPDESDVTPDSPNGYAASKISGEAIANAYSRTADLSVTSLRLANVYGPFETNRRVIPIFVSRAFNGDQLTVYGKKKLLDFVHIDDVCDAMLAVIRRPEIVRGEAINIGSGSGTQLTKLAQRVADSIESCPGWNFSSDRSGDVTQYISNISKAQKLLGYEPAIELDEGLTKTIEWYQNHPRVREMIIPGKSAIDGQNP